ncbi:MAG: ketosteroid isomerase [Candidatus Melainabacteria bacterium HGW-Melainabacteria-1]|nr:MAG: ketosteroid isomerase [Candidatus Melainabacteria bacterium HGW-Melainabacteria-1]
MRQDYAERQLIADFYKAFAAHDGARMAASYHPEAEFSDPVFGTLKGPEIGAMWQMLIAAGGQGLHIRYRDVEVRQGQGRAHWDADYVFGATGLPVHNQIDAEFSFKDGLIYRHHDRFDLHRWSSQALGLPGLLFGHTPMLANTLRTQARARLKEWTQ